MPTSVRLDLETEMLLKRLARRSGRSKSAVLREALHRLAQDGPALDEDSSAHSMISDLIGVATAGPTRLGREHKKAYRDALVAKRRR